MSKTKEGGKGEEIKTNNHRRYLLVKVWVHTLWRRFVVSEHDVGQREMEMMRKMRRLKTKTKQKRKKKQLQTEKKREKRYLKVKIKESYKKSTKTSLQCILSCPNWFVEVEKSKSKIE